VPEKPSDKEEEYFARQEYERRKREADLRAQDMAQEERRRLQELHRMRCPKCGMELAEVAFRDLKVDRCTACGGVWLDAGELERVARTETGGAMARFAGLFGRDKTSPGG
jgi:hypothetical protein